MEQKPELGVPESINSYVTLSDAIELTGFASHYLRRMIKEGRIETRGGLRDPMIPWFEVRRLNEMQRPFWQTPLPELPSDQLLVTSDPLLQRNKDEDDAGELVVKRVPVTDSVEAGHSIEWLQRIPSDFVQTVITSPPYWGQRRYSDEKPVLWADGESVAYGREATVEGYVRHSLEVLRHLKRVMRADGTIWWVMGDTYQTRTVIKRSTLERWKGYKKELVTKWANNPDRRHSAGHPYLKDKDLTLVPFMVAHGAQHLGLYVRSIIVWSKQQSSSRRAGIEPSRSHMPEPVKDRPTTGHEYILLMARSDRYLYSLNDLEDEGFDGIESLANLRTVWSFPVSTNHGGHTAAFPIELPRRCLRLTSKPGDIIVDPFAGSGNTLIAAKQLNRHYLGCDFSPAYVLEARQRLDETSVGSIPILGERQRRSLLSPTLPMDLSGENAKWEVGASTPLEAERDRDPKG